MASLGCKVTLLNAGFSKVQREKCGQPVVRDGLCAKHLADRERLGGDAT